VNQPLAIVGASTRAAAASARRAGFQPLAADLFADADLRAMATTTRIAPYPEGFLDWMRAIEPRAWMYTGALENHPERVDQLAWIAPLWGNPGDVLERVRSPHEVASALSHAGLRFPETRDLADGLPRNGSWLAKTCRGASGSGVHALSDRGREGEWEKGKGDASTTSRESPSLPLSSSPRLYYQQRVAGRPCAAAFVAEDGDAMLLGVTRQLIGEPWLGAHGFQYAGSIGPLPIDGTVEATIRGIGRVVAEQFELAGVFGVDFILDGDQVWVVEVNPRYTASMEICERISGLNVIGLHARLFQGNANISLSAGDARAPTRSAAASHGKAILFAKRDIKISQLFAEVSLAEALRMPWPTLADVSPAGTIIEVGRPILTVFADGQTMEAVEQRLRQRVLEIEQLLYGGDVP